MSDEQKRRTEQSAESSEASLKLPPDRLVETKHSVVINGKELRYTITTGTLVLKQEAEGEGDQAGTFIGEKARASIFFIAYTLDDVPDKSERPVTFSFNGGPGSSSVWLHLGALGPRRVLMSEIGDLLPPPYRLVDNEHSLLDVTDLVFIDPVSTGYSRPVEGEKAKAFHDIEKDIESVGDFIRLYCTRYHRWPSAKFLIGESYGTTRAAGLSGYLQERHGMYLNGIMLVSTILDFMTVDFEPGNDLPAILHLPTYTATAWYHGKLSKELQRDLRATLEQVQSFAMGDYALALLKGDALTAEERTHIVAQLAHYTGLSPAYIERTNLRIEIHRFTKELLREERRTVGRLDTRFTGIDRDAVGETSEYDPSFTNILGPYTATFNDYVRRELRFECDLPYEILNLRIWPWRFSAYENRYVNLTETLRKAMTRNPYLKVFVGSGYYDLATPYFAADYTINHLGLDQSLQRNITTRYYEAGHMMYLHLPSLAQLKQDLAGFLLQAVATSE